MAIVYFDSSALVKLLVEEEGSEVVAALWDGCDLAVASAGRDHRLTSDDVARAETLWETYWDAVRPVELTASVSSTAGSLAGRYALRGSDAVHLASVVAVGVHVCVVAVWDARLHAGAAAVGARTAPSSLDG